MNRPIMFAVLGLLAMSDTAFAKCEVTQPTTNIFGFVVANGDKHTETDCASKDETDTALSLKADKAATDTALALKADKSDTYTKDETDGKVVVLQEQIDEEKIKTAKNTSDIAAHETRITQTEAKNGEQDGKLDDHETRITKNTSDIATTNDRLNSFNGTGGSLETWATGTDAHLATVDRRLDNIDAMLGKHARGLAIAMALPDAWLSDHEKFALAFNVGGFDSETAFGAAAIFRINHNWSGNMKIGTDSGFNEIGWTVGARYGF